MVETLRKMLGFLDEMEDPEELRALTARKVHTMTGDRKGTWSLSVTRNRRLTFDINTAELEVYDVNLEDYHWAKGAAPKSMKNLPHPGDFIRMEIIEPAGLTALARAMQLQGSRPALSSLLNGKATFRAKWRFAPEAFGVKMDTLM
jgi:toxin HigB-1